MVSYFYLINILRVKEYYAKVDYIIYRFFLSYFSLSSLFHILLRLDLVYSY